MDNVDRRGPICEAKWEEPVYTWSAYPAKQDLNARHTLLNEEWPGG